MFTAPTTDTVFFDNNVNLAMIQDTGSSFYTYSNGVAQSQTNANYSRGTTSLDTYVLGAKYNLGTMSDWFNGTLSELIIVNGTLSAGNRERLEGYQAHKWNASGNLPGGHTYKSRPPAN
jgi:hypothetical protein